MQVLRNDLPPDLQIVAQLNPNMMVLDACRFLQRTVALQPGSRVPHPVDPIKCRFRRVNAPKFFLYTQVSVVVQSLDEASAGMANARTGHQPKSFVGSYWK